MATSRRNATLAFLFALAAIATPAAAQPAAVTGCETCHAGHGDTRVSDPARAFAGSDAHRERGFTCVNCHGGNPTATDKLAAKAPSSGFKGKPTGQAVIAVCSSCHSDATIMRKFAPRQRIDQAAEYVT